MELSIQYITEHLQDFCPKESIDGLSEKNCAPNYAYNHVWGEWDVSFPGRIKKKHEKNFNIFNTSDSDFDEWYEKNIVPVWAFMPLIKKNGKVSGKVVKGFIYQDDEDIIFTTEGTINCEQPHNVYFDSLAKGDYDLEGGENFQMFDNEKEAKEAYNILINDKIGDKIKSERAKNIDKQIQDLNKKIEKLKAEKQQLLS